MKTSSLTLRRVVVWALVIALLATMGLAAAAGTAQAATAYTLTAKGCGTTTTAKACKITVTYKKGKTKIKKATAQLQYFNGAEWVNEKSGKIEIKKGKGAVSIKNKTTSRTYRVKAGSTVSKSFVVHFIPAKFSITGSGAGHGAGMSQYGAYELARQGRTAAEILEYYYPGTTLSTANNPGATATATGTSGKIKVQVLGPPADSRTSTTLTVKGSGFTVLDSSGKQLGSYPTAGKVAIGISGSKVTAKVTLDNGKVKNKKLTSTSRVRLVWDNAKGAVSVTGAQGTYRYGNLQVTVLQKRLNVANELVLNTEYLYGVDEVPASWANNGGKEALKAQVIAARNYALQQVTKRRDNAVDPACDCHVFDDTLNQNYTGWRKAGLAANKPWVDAVNATVHVVPVSSSYPSGSAVDVLRVPSGAFAETPYFASTGSGAVDGTGPNADVFGTTQLAHLPGVADPYSAGAPGNPYRSWTSTLTQDDAAKVFGMAGVTRISVTARYSGGLVRTLEATTAAGKTASVTLPAATWIAKFKVNGPWIKSIGAS